MPIVEFDVYKKTGVKTAVDTRRVERVERSRKDAAGNPVTLLYLIDRIAPIRVARAYAAAKTDLTPAGWGA